MSEKSKRVRPTVGQVREMEEVVHRQCVELNEWRDAYRGLSADYEKAMSVIRKEDIVSGEQYRELQDRNNVLERSNGMLEKELDRHRMLCDESDKMYNDALDEIERLNGRGFWKRLFNL